MLEAKAVLDKGVFVKNQPDLTCTADTVRCMVVRKHSFEAVFRSMKDVTQA